jgi:GH35 family endo-1,4-beta-xylanase
LGEDPAPVLSFRIHPSNGSDLPRVRGAYLIGADGVPARGTVVQEGELLRCESRSDDALALSLLWPVPGYGTTQLETTRLPARPEPYALLVELARHRLMKINVKREEWGLFDYPGMDGIIAEIDAARDLFIKALQASDASPAAQQFAEESLARAVHASEAMSIFHAEVFLKRRRQLRGFSKPLLGIRLPLKATPDAMVKSVAEAFEFTTIPVTWREIEPKENERSYDRIDQIMALSQKTKLPIHAGPLLSLSVTSLPDWMYIWENDHDTIMELAREHVRQTVKRYGKQVKNWIVCSGLHANDALALNFEHMLELTRTACVETRKSSSQAKAIIELTQPWGEYFARNPRTIPPVVYAEMVAQSGIPFDAFGLQFLFGIDSSGYRLRDLLQISAYIDRLANLGKPLHITGVCVPSDGATGGRWRSAWSPETQAEWLELFAQIALSRPFVETVCFQTLCDAYEEHFPSSGLFGVDNQPKVAIERLTKLRQLLREGSAT